MEVAENIMILMEKAAELNSRPDQMWAHLQSVYLAVQAQAVCEYLTLRGWLDMQTEFSLSVCVTCQRTASNIMCQSSCWLVKPGALFHWGALLMF